MKKKITLFLVIVLGVIGVGSGVWLSKSYAACQLAQEALITDDNITVENGDYISFTPKNKEVTKGYTFCPGLEVSAVAPYFGSNSACIEYSTPARPSPESPIKPISWAAKSFSG